MSAEKLKQEIQQRGGASAEHESNDPAGDVELGDEELGSVAGGIENPTTGTTDLVSTECCTLPTVCPDTTAGTGTLTVG